MILSNVNIGTGPSAGDGDPLRTAFNTINQNFDAIESNVNALTNSVSSVAGRQGNVILTTQDIVGINNYATISYVNSQLANAGAANISALQSNVAALQADINTLYGNAGVQSSTLATLTSNAATQAGSLATLTSNAASQAGELTTLLSNAAVQAGEIASLLSNAGSQHEAISSLQANVSTLFTNAGAQSGTLTTLTSNAAVQAGAIADIKNGVATFGNLIPSANVAYSLGNITHQWKDLWVSNNTIYINSIPLSIDNGGNLLINGNTVAGSSYANVAVKTYLENYDGDINFSSGHKITQQLNRDFQIRVSDNEDDGWALQTIVDNGTGTDLTRTSVEYNQFRINTDLPSGNHEWSFQDNGQMYVPGAINGPTGSNFAIRIGGQLYAAPSYIDIETRSPVGDAIISQIRVGDPNVTIGTSSTAHKWIFEDTNKLVIPQHSVITTANANGGLGGNTISIIGGASDADTWNSNPGGNVDIQGGYGSFGDGGGGPGGDVNIRGGGSSDAQAGRVIISSGANDWLFDWDGNTTIPGGITSDSTITITNANTSNVADILIQSGDDITLQAKDRLPGNDAEGGDINIYAGDGCDDNGVDGTSSAGDVTIEGGRGGAANVSSGGSGGVVAIRGGVGGSASLTASAGGGSSISLTAGDAGSNGGDPNLGNLGGDVNIRAGDSNNTSANGGIITLTTGTNVDGANRIAGYVEINIPISNIGEGGTWTFDGTGRVFNTPQNAEIFGAGAGNLTVGSSGNTFIRSLNYSSLVPYTWQFSDLGVLTLPGNIISGNSRVNFVSNSSGDGYGSSTIQLIPETGGAVGGDQYLVIDPTSPNHIHLRAGGTPDNSGTQLFVGGENSHLRVDSGLNPNVYISANSQVWNFSYGALTLPGEGIIRSIDDTVALQSVNTSSGFANSVYLGSSGGLGFNDSAIAGNWLEIFRSGATPEITSPTGNLKITTVITGVSSNTWTYGTDGSITFPDNTVQTTAWTGDVLYGNTIAIGYQTGNTSQGNNAVAIGSAAGQTSQGAKAIGIGEVAGRINQGIESVGLGAGAGEQNQGAYAIAIGSTTAYQNQGVGAVAIGTSAGALYQGEHAIAIGTGAGNGLQGNNSIILNATGNMLDQTTDDTFTVAPIRNTTGSSGVLQYNSGTSEVTYNTNVTLGNITAGNVLANGISGKIGYSNGNFAQQTTSNSTQVTSHFTSGNIQLMSINLAAHDVHTVAFACNKLTTNDMLIVKHIAGGITSVYVDAYVASDGLAVIWMRDITGVGTGAFSPMLKYAIIRAPSS